jgi:hypothetical protein
MAKILNFEDFLSKRELARIEVWARKEFAPVVKLGERRRKPLVSLKSKPASEPPKAA